MREFMRVIKYLPKRVQYWLGYIVGTVERMLRALSA
jgi:hypothetical protein